MGTITALKEQQKNKKRVNVYIDDEYRCSLDVMAAFSFGLRVGREIDDARLEEVIRDSENKSSFDAAVRYLTTRMRSALEVECYLNGKGYLETSIASTVDKLKEYGYIDDEKFAIAYISQYREKYGNKKLVFELLRLGINQSIVDELLSGGENDESLACEAATKKYIRTHRPPIVKEKLITYLYGKGFAFEVARKVADSIDLL